jgi:hypothetical protein
LKLRADRIAGLDKANCFFANELQKLNSMEGRWNFSFMDIFSLFMVLVYFGLGIYLFVTDTLDYIPSMYRVVFAVIMILYGSFRLVRVISKLKNPER